MKKPIRILALSLILIIVAGYAMYRRTLIPQAPAPATTNRELTQDETPPQEDIVVVARDLKIPWEIAFLPNGDLLVTERPGDLLRIGLGGRRYPIQGVRHIGEGGLLGMALHPKFEKNQWVYLYLTTATENGLQNRVERYRLGNDSLSEKKVIIKDIPGAVYHDGGRMEFGPDGMLYITTGDARNKKLAQDTRSLAGKILRLKDDGSIPEDNPFGSPVYSYGHRNPQGITWDQHGRLWSSEHGATGVDELNLIEKGNNYGWPIIQGDDQQENMKSPILHSAASTWAPAGAEYWDGSIFFGGLRGEALYEAINLEGTISLKTHFFKQFGRIRAVRLGPDGMLYLTTSNRDGRGKVQPGDDKIIRVNPSIFR
ncbi:PQQ-dependent sugar dehydrogenase [Patescibacteria group bacterium]|nr:PQQ-dependent sugar dehydrogenase [Patescibacteria group bacterium]